MALESNAGEGSGLGERPPPPPGVPESPKEAPERTRTTSRNPQKGGGGGRGTKLSREPEEATSDGRRWALLMAGDGGWARCSTM